ncbi:MAG: response regulator [Deltaproteobacteria bacterium]|nr:response regulator [Deltaproteobacteria bacterium]
MPMRILVVDDDLHQLRSVKRYLNAAGLSVITCNSSAEAVLALQGIQIDAVLTDIQMPEESGLTLIRWMDEHLPNVPVFAMTAFGSDEIYQDVLQNGAVVYLEKPVDLKLLVQLLATTKDTCRHANCFVTACLEAASTRGTGEVVTHSQNQIGQIFYYEGKIAWAAIQNNSTSFMDELLVGSKLEKDDLVSLIRDCKRENLEFFFELTKRNMVQENMLVKIIHRYIAQCFLQCLQWDNAKSMYIPNTRPYQGRILFDLVDILTLANTTQKFIFRRARQSANM